MNRARGFLARLAGALRGRRAEDELHDEMEAHLAMETAEYIRRGMSPEAARRQALLASGGLAQATDSVRDQRGLPWLESVVSDLRYAVRALRRAPAFTIVVVLTLALGIGANTAIFSVVRGVLLRPLPHRDGDRLVYLRQSSDAYPNNSFSVPEVRDFRTGAPALADIAEYSSWTATLLDNESPKSIGVGLVTGNFFAIMGLSPVLGRLTVPGDDGRGAAPVMVLTHEFWQRHFAGDSAVVGRSVRTAGGSILVIGVLQPAPYFPDRVSAFTNMVVSTHHLDAVMTENRVHRMTEMIARLAPGATVEQARSEVETVHARARNEHPDAYDPGAHFRVALVPFKQVMGERAQLMLWVLMGAAAFVLVITAANVANLTLMRGVRREHELAVRAALGAGVARLRRLLLAENLVLTVAGAALGLLLAVAGLGMLVAFAQRVSPRADEIRLDATVLGFAVALSITVALLLSYLASLPKEGSFAAWISAGGRRLSATLGKHRLQSALVITQVAVSVMLLAGAGLLTRTMVLLSDVDTGLRTESVLTLPVQVVDFSKVGPGTDAAAKQLYNQMKQEVAALPGVTRVGVGSTMPLRDAFFALDVKAENRAVAAGAAVPSAGLRTADPDYFRAAGIPLLSGRDFAATDRDSSGSVLIINRALADQLFPGEDPVGRRMAFTGALLALTPFSGEWRTVVGVVGNTLDGGLDAPPKPLVFAPFAQVFTFTGGLVIRTDSNPEALASAATRIVRRLAPTAPIESVLTYSQIKAESIAPRRLNAMLVSSFGLLALIIAAVGIASVLAFSVSARTNEIGIRMSLGADGGRVQLMILREGGVLLAIGLVLGVAGGWFASGALRGLLFGVAPHDPITFTTVAVAMAAIGILACWIPALRAARVDPAITMRAS